MRQTVFPEPSKRIGSELTISLCRLSQAPSAFSFADSNLSQHLTEPESETKYLHVMAIDATTSPHFPTGQECTPWIATREDWMNLRRSAHAADVSPLRYPGGKRKLALLVAQIFALSETRPKLLIEPFAGGASVSISLLESGFVDEIALADTDELVASFWQVVFSDEAAAFADMIEATKVTMKERRRLLASRPRTAFNLAYKCLFLNRTSFSGILKETAGAIGGKNQRGEYKLGCRFNRHRIAERIRSLSNLRHRVRFVRCQSYNETLAQVLELPEAQFSPNSVFWYFDPPFFEKASRLYRKSFRAEDHVAFKAVLEHVPGHFVLSYDDVAESEKMYGDDKRLMRFGLQYTMNGDDQERPKVKELILSDLTSSFKTKLAVHNRTRSILSSTLTRKGGTT